MNKKNNLGICLSNHNNQIEFWLINVGAMEDEACTLEMLIDLMAFHGIDLVKLKYPKHYKYII